MVAGGIGQRRNHHQSHHQSYDDNSALFQYQSTLLTAEDLTATKGVDNHSHANPSTPSSHNRKKTDDDLDRHPLRLHQTWQQQQEVRGEIKDNYVELHAVQHYPCPPPSHHHHHYHCQIQQQRHVEGPSYEGTSFKSSVAASGPDTDELVQPKLPKRRYILKPDISTTLHHHQDHQQPRLHTTRDVEEGRFGQSNKAVAVEEDDNQLLVANILEGITRLCLGPTSNCFNTDTIKTNRKRTKLDRCRSDRRFTNRSRQQHDRLVVQNNVINGQHLMVTSNDMKSNNVDCNCNSNVDSASNSSSNVHIDTNNLNTSKQRRSSSLISTCILNPSQAILPGPSKRKRAVYPIATYEGSTLDCRKLIMERRQVFQQNLFRPVSNDEMSQGALTAGN